MLRRMWRRRPVNTQIRALLAVLGPGIIAASAGNDAGGVTTYSSAGAAYGYNLLWVLFLLTFSLTIAQEMGARMAAVTGKGLADLIREELGVRVTMFAMAALVVANVGTTVANFAGIAAVAEMVLPRDARLWVVPVIAGGIWLLVARGSYRRVERVFLALCLVYLTYVVAAIAAEPPWGLVLRRTVVPDFRSLPADAAYLTMVVALVGTTIAPWMQFYLQSSVRDKRITVESYPLERMDVTAGAVLSNVISFFIVVTCGAVLHAQSARVETVADLAGALQFLGPAGSWLFGIGLFNAAMVGASIVPLSTAYAVTESLGWESGLGRRIREAPLFIGVYTVVIVLSALLILVPGISLLGVIVAAQVVNGFLLPVVLVLMVRLINKRRLMGEHVNSGLYNIVAWTTVAAVAGVSLIYVAVTLVDILT